MTGEAMWAVVCDQEFYPWIDYYDTEDEARSAFAEEKSEEGRTVLLVYVVESAPAKRQEAS